ncbi:MAG: CHASE domain-containing protein [Synechococcaceae cyanobacterium]|nr:CHASE domain-containing protein [Synechococcaceae cyanobacterium]
MPRRLAASLPVALLYLGVGGLTFLLLSGTGWSAPLWPAAGIAFAFVFAEGPGALAGVALGSLLLNLLVYGRAGLPPAAVVGVSLVIAAAITLQAWAGALAVRATLGARPALHRGGEILRFMLLPGPLACLIASTLGVLTLLQAGAIAADQASRAWLTWWVGDAVGVIVFAPLTLMALPSQAPRWSGRRVAVAVPSLLVLALTLAAFLYTASLERRELELRLARRGDEALARLQRNLAAHGEALHGIRSLLEATGGVSRTQFRQFTAGSLERLQGLQALSWNPLLSGADLAGFERAVQREGLPGFRVTERAAGGALVPVRPGPRHVPVAAIEPLAANRAALGFDIATDPIRRRALERALQTGLPQATAPIRLVQESGSQQGVLVVLPVPGDPSPGFAVGVYRLGDLLADTYAGGSWDLFRLRLLDRSEGDRPLELARFPRAGSVSAPSAWSVLPTVRRGVPWAGRRWELELQPTSAYLADARSASAPGLLLGGLLLSGLLEGFLLLTTGLERESQRELEQKLRTGLRAAAVAHEIKQPLATLLLQARALTAALDRREPRGEEAGRDSLRQAVEAIGREARRVSHTIDRMRDILGSVVSRPEPIDLAEAIRGALLVARLDLTRRGIRVLSEGLEEPLRVMGDRGQLQVVLLNLIRNACEAMGSGGTLRIRAHGDPRTVEVAVEDDGPGFPAGITSIDQVLLASAKPEGTGIGLFVVGCAMRNHEGSVHLGRSELGGARVTLRLPRLG